MEKLNVEQIEQLLKFEKEIIASANHKAVQDKVIWDIDGDTISSLTQTSTMVF